MLYFTGIGSEEL